MNYIFHKRHIHIITISRCLLCKPTYNCYNVSGRNIELQFVFSNVSRIELHWGVICFEKFEPILVKKLLKASAISRSPIGVSSAFLNELGMLILCLFL